MTTHIHETHAYLHLTMEPLFPETLIKRQVDNGSRGQAYIFQFAQQGNNNGFFVLSG